MNAARSFPRRCRRRAPALLSACALFATTSLVAQVEEDVVELDELVATARADDIYDVLPSRPTASVFGTTRDVIETPRSITTIDSSLVDLFGIRTVNDFVAMTAGSFTGNYFGVAGALDVRGERADNFFRGFRRVENRGNFPTPIASTDYVEIVKGPPPPIYGGGKVGGILNFIPKTAKSRTAKFIEKPTGLVSATVGTYSKLSGSIEYGTPFEIGGKRSGAYLFLQTEDSGHYYHDIYNKGTMVQLALETELSESVTIEYGAMFQNADLNQSLGWNRVTQDLIDSRGGRYLAGTPALDLDTDGDGFLSPSEVQPYALEQFAYADPFPYANLTAAQQAAFALDPSTVRTVSLSHHQVQAESIDFSETDAFTAYFDITKRFDMNLSIKNQTFYDSMDHLKYSSYGFTADYVAMVFENKTSINYNFRPSESVRFETVSGVSWRYSDGDERESRGRGYQVLDRRDISAGADGNTRFEGAFTGTGNVPYNWRQEGDFSDLGVFALIDGRIGERLGFVVSGRWDSYEADTFGTNLAAVYDRAEGSESAFTYNASVSYALPGGVNAYVTHAESDYLELGQGGMIARETISGGTWLQGSEITEFGLKGSLLKGRLVTTLAWYEQEKSSYNTQSSSYDYYTSEGLEFEARYAPSRTLSFTAAATWQDTKLLNAPFFLGLPPEVLGLDPALVYGGRFVGLGGTIGVSAPVDAPTPEQVFSLNGTYTNPKGWGFSLGGTYVSSFYSGYAQAVTLPSYFVTRAAMFYNTGPWSFRLNANNVLDEKYYNPQFLFWDVFVSPSVGPTAELTVSYKW